MNNQLLSELQLQAGGSHYPLINPEIQEAFARLVIKECVESVKRTNKSHTHTTYDLDLIEATIQRSINSINETFGLDYVYHTTSKSYKNITSE